MIIINKDEHTASGPSTPKPAHKDELEKKAISLSSSATDRNETQNDGNKEPSSPLASKGVDEAIVNKNQNDESQTLTPLSQISQNIDDNVSPFRIDGSLKATMRRMTQKRNLNTLMKIMSQTQPFLSA